MKKFLKRFRKIKWNYSLTIITTLSIVLLLLIIGALISYNSSNQQNTGGLILNEDHSINTSNGNLVAVYKLSANYENINLKVITLYVTDINNISASDLKAMKDKILSKENLSEKEVYFNVQQFNELADRSTEDTLNTDNLFDIQDPTTYSNVPKNYEYSEEIINVPFKAYVRAVQPRTEKFDIYEQSENKYLVVLKQGYTELEFRRDYLSQFLQTENLSFEFKTKADLVQ